MGTRVTSAYPLREAQLKALQRLHEAPNSFEPVTDREPSQQDRPLGRLTTAEIEMALEDRQAALEAHLEGSVAAEIIGTTIDRLEAELQRRRLAAIR